MSHKATLRKEIHLDGVGVHSGKHVNLCLKPSTSGKVVFKRVDLGGREMEAASSLVDAGNCTVLVKDSLKVQTVEHLLAALFVAGIDSVLVELDGDEIPILDGSAIAFVESIAAVGTKSLAEKKKTMRVVRGFSLQEGEALIEVSPDADFRISYEIEYDHPVVGKQALSLTLNAGIFSREIAPARTFGFLKDVPQLYEQGLALGGSLENALVLDDKKVINGPLRFPDEFVRHKILDFIGDLSLLGAPLQGFFRAKKAGHALHQKAVRYLLDHPASFSLESS